MPIPALVPAVHAISASGGSFTLPKKPTISFQAFAPSLNSKWLVENVSNSIGRTVVKATNRATVLCKFQQGFGIDEAYDMKVGKDGITITAGSFRGFVWALQTLRQLRQGNTIPFVSIQDQPSFRWRGVMVDEGRHFMGAQVVKSLLDVMSRLKLNMMHWHLTEDQGWRIQIKKYPRLTDFGGTRTEADGSVHQGFYTQAEIRSIVQYASQRGIEIVPEIELPGHCTAALACYPNFGCRNQKLKITNSWGVFQDVYCAGRESTFGFLQDVLTEVASLFPSKYIHIGGDEVPKDRWSKCPDCQKRIHDLNLVDEHGLQSYFVKRIQTFLTSKGKTLVGWDEIMEGGLAPGAVVQIWNDQKLTQRATSQGNSVVLSPNSHLYLNRPADQLTMKQVYGYDWRTDGLTEAQRHLVLGIETPLWSENITRLSLIPQFLPRGLASAELCWSDSKKDYTEFIARARNVSDRWRTEGILIGPEDRSIASYKIAPSSSGRFIIKAESGVKNAIFRYAIDGKPVTSSSPSFKGSIDLPVGKRGELAPYISTLRISASKNFETLSHLAVGKTLAIPQPMSKQYSANGPSTLVDGLLASADHHDGQWLGWQGKSVTGTLDLGEVKTIHTVALHCLQQTQSWIVYPPSVWYEVSTDGVKWTHIGEVKAPVKPEAEGTRVHWFEVSTKTKARFVRFAAAYPGPLPSWHLGAGSESFIFADEFVVK